MRNHSASTELVLQIGRHMGNFIVMAPFIKYIHTGNGQGLRLNKHNLKREVIAS